jgi:hypothetical protein
MDNYSSFNTAPYASCTTDHLKAAVAEGRGNDKMVGEIARRAKVAAGDFSVATPGERLRAVRAGLI